MVYFNAKEDELRFYVNQFRFFFHSGKKKLVVVFDNGGSGLFFDEMEVTPEYCLVNGMPYGKVKEQGEDKVIVDFDTVLLEVSFTPEGKGVYVCLSERKDGVEKPLDAFIFRKFAGEWEVTATDPYGIYEAFLKITKTAEGVNSVS